MTKANNLVVTAELLPCPFCGAEAFRADGGTCFIGCPSSTEECPVSPTVRSFGNDDAVRFWNTRTNDQAISTLTAEVEELRAEKAELIEAVAAVKSLIDESEGVGGLHLNGDFAHWSELRSGGRFEDWLSPLDAVISRQPYFATLTKGEGDKP